MALNSKNTNSIWMLLLVTIIGLVLGSYISLVINQLLLLIAGENMDQNVIRFFTKNLPLAIGYTDGNPDPFNINLGAIKLSLGFQLDINVMSFLGIWLAHKFYKSYK